MKRSKFNETKILAILKEAEAGMAVSEISRKYGIFERHILQLEEQVRWHERFGDQTHASA